MALTQIMTFAGFMPADVVNQQGTPMPKPLIIQLLGQARAGKDWTATQLKQAFEARGKSVAILSYAAPMKRITAALFDISLEQVDAYKNNPKHYSIFVCTPSNRTVLQQLNFRTFLQALGNQAMKAEFGDSVWADLMKAQIAKADVDVVIIPDCRFQVELNAFPEALTVRIINRDLGAPLQHASETELINFVPDYFLDNTAHAIKYVHVENLVEHSLSVHLS